MPLHLARHYPYSERTERVVALGRLVLVFISFIAIWLDPTEPHRFAAATYGMLGAYLAYAVVLAVITWRLRRMIRGLQVGTHVLDLIVAIAVMYFTEGPTSPFFVYFVFAVVVATLRWQSVGTVATAGGALCAFLVLGYVSAQVLHDPYFELNRFVIRAVYLGIVAILLTQFDRYNRIVRQELERLARWRRASPVDTETLLRDTLPEAVAIIGARRGLVVWEEAEEPWRSFAYAGVSGVEFSRKPPGTYGSLVPPSLVDDGFMCVAKPPRIVRQKDGSIQSTAGDGIDTDLRAAFSITDFVSVPLRGDDIQGRLFFLDHPVAVTECLFTAAIIGTELLARMEGVRLLAELQRAAAFDERMRTAADLHDGLLQSLTAAGLELATASKHVPRELTEAHARLTRIQDLVAEERRELRALIDDMRRGQPTPTENFDLAARLTSLQEQVQRHWSLQVEVRTEGEALACCASAGDRFARQVYYLAHEGVTNVARHARASRAEVSLTTSQDMLHLRILDNGRGFPMHGHYDLDALEAMGFGPAALSRRVRGLHGAFVLDSDNSGSRITIVLPLAPA